MTQENTSPERKPDNLQVPDEKLSHEERIAKYGHVDTEPRSNSNARIFDTKGAGITAEEKEYNKSQRRLK
jgi:hypothetical protein